LPCCAQRRDDHAVLDADLPTRPAVPYRAAVRRDLSPAAVAEAMIASGGNISRAA
jgi:hypothetical protein